MKSIACIFALLALSQSCAFGAVAQGVYKDPRYPGKCTIRENLILSAGQEVTDPEQCRLISCGRNSVVGISECGVFVVECGKKAEVNKSAPYPECCEPRVVCPE